MAVIDILRSDEIINKIGGRFKLTALIQKRWLQIVQGARPMVASDGLTDLEIVIKEIAEGKIEPVYIDTDEESDATA